VCVGNEGVQGDGLGEMAERRKGKVVEEDGCSFLTALGVVDWGVARQTRLSFEVAIESVGDLAENVTDVAITGKLSPASVITLAEETEVLRASIYCT
jgi:hypothetical protein